MTRIKLIVSAAVGTALVAVGLAAENVSVLMAMISLALGFAWFLQCLFYVQDQTAAQVFDWLRGSTVRVAGPGLHFAFFPKEKPARRISTRRVIVRGTTPGGCSTDGIPCDIRWSVWYQLAPQNMPPDSIPSNADLLFRSPNMVLYPLVGSVLLRLVSQRTGVGLATAGGWDALNGSFEQALRVQVKDEGFAIQKAMIEGIEFPTFVQMAFHQAATPGPVARPAVPQAPVQQYAKITGRRTAAERALIQGKGRQRTMKKTLTAQTVMYDLLKYLP